MRRFTAPFLLLSIAFLLLLSGCDDMERSVTKAAEDPKYLPTAYASVAGLICLLLVFFQDWGIWRSLLNTVRYMGILCVVGGPLYWVGSGNVEASLALMVSGIVSAAMVTVVFRDDFRNWSEKED